MSLVLQSPNCYWVSFTHKSFEYVCNNLRLTMEFFNDQEFQFTNPDAFKKLTCTQIAEQEANLRLFREVYVRAPRTGIWTLHSCQYKEDRKFPYFVNDDDREIWIPQKNI